MFSKLVLVVAISAPLQTKAADSVEGQESAAWGTAIDPDGDCKIQQAGRVLTIAVPGTLHDLSPSLKKWNTPRLLREVESDFIVKVKIVGDFKPRGRSTKPKGEPQNRAGLLIWRDGDNFIRLERSAVFRNGKVSSFALFEERASQHRNENTAVLTPGTAFLSMERKGNRLTASVSNDGRQWHKFKPLEITWSGPLQVGLEADNSAAEPFSVRFEEFSLEGVGVKVAQAPGQDAANTPEAVFRSFMIAVLTHDEPTIRSLMLKTEGIEWLLKGTEPTPDQILASRPASRSYLSVGSSQATRSTCPADGG
jgi:regulation of enolase protein 1 (concanavalin A-like superfamily)